MNQPAFNRILIANRGEIALRILRTARAQGYRVIMVYSEADAGSQWWRGADQAICIGPAPAQQSYLNITAILQAAQHSGAQAIHPGYGFLAENPAFAAAVQAAGLVWIGPSVAAMQAMGNKAAAKRSLRDTSVPLLPGYAGTEQALPYLLEQAQQIGVPMMIKAQAGGGGRGMRLLAEACSTQELENALTSARAEALLAFGNGDLLIERALLAPRHIEVQVFADSHGNIVHVGERECSLQRRHQKLVEESPSPVVDAALRARLGQAAITVARQCDYLGAGTVEFLLDGQQEFWFMEMNTRLQVEHTVTEEICGLDLVAWQFLVAQGHALPLTQAEIDARLQSGGHAIEVRLCAEDMQQDFMPQSGPVRYWQAAPGVRCETALRTGEQISSHYDSMLAKIIVHGAHREQARQRLRHALRHTHLLGFAHNQAFLLSCIEHPSFASGQFSTHFIAEHLPQLLAAAQFCQSQPQQGTRPGTERTPAQSSEQNPDHLAFAAVAMFHSQRAQPSYPQELANWASNAPAQWACRFVLAGKSYFAHWQYAAKPSTHTSAQHSAAGNSGSFGNLGIWQVKIGAHSWQIDPGVFSPAANQTLQLQINGRYEELAICQDGTQIFISHAGKQCYISEMLPRGGKLANNGQDPSGQDASQLHGPFNGRLVRVLAEVGEIVEKGQVLLVLEAMKMEHSMRAPYRAKVLQLLVQVGQQVEPGKLMLALEAQHAAEDSLHPARP